MGLSNDMEQAFLNHNFRPGQPAYSFRPLWISLHEGGGPDDDGSGEIDNTGGGSYARFAITTPATFWNAAASQSVSNAQVAQFTGMPTTGRSLTGCGIWAHATSQAPTDFVAGGLLQGQPIAVSGGATAEFGAGQLVINWNTLHYDNVLKNQWLDFLLRNIAYTRASSHTLQIYSGDPSSGGSAVGGATPQAISFGVPAPVGSRHDIANDADITFPALTADTLSYWGVSDQQPQLLAYRDQANLTINNGDSVEFDQDTDCIVGID